MQKHIDCHFCVNACRERSQNIHHRGIHACTHSNSINANAECSARFVILHVLYLSS